MIELASSAVEAALAAGARYADARVMVVRHETIAARNGVVEDLTLLETAGIGVRALLGSSWGFQATPELTDAAARTAGAGATAVARASATVPGPPLELAPAPAFVASWSSTWVEHPLDDVGVGERADLLVAATNAATEAGVPLSHATSQVWDTEKWFASSEGSRIDQRIVECGAVVDATAIGDGETQRRSYPGVRGQYGTQGWELVRGLDLVANAASIAEQAQALLSAPACSESVTTVILDSSQVALQIHESVGHAVEVDRIHGWEAALGRRSPGRRGSTRHGSATSASAAS
jgi:TldD protein